MTSPLPQTPSSSFPDATDFEKYEDFILEEYMDIAFENNSKSSGPVHPSHFSDISPEDRSLFVRNSPEIILEADRSEDRYHANEEGATEHPYIHGKCSINEEIRRNPSDCPAAEYVKTASPSINEDTNSRSYSSTPRRSSRFRILSRADNYQETVDSHKDHMSATFDLDRSSKPISASHQQDQEFTDMIEEECSESTSVSSGEVWVPNASDMANSRQPSRLKEWNHRDTDYAQRVKSESRLEATTDPYANMIRQIEHNEPRYPVLPNQNVQTMKPLTEETRTYPFEIDELHYISSDDDTDTLLIDESSRKYERRPSVIVRSPSVDVPVQCVQNNQSKYSTETRTNDPVIIGKELQQQQEWQEWTANTGSFPLQGFTGFGPNSRWNEVDELHGARHDSAAISRIPTVNTAAWSSQPMGDQSVLAHRHNTAKQGESSVQQHTDYIRVHSEANDDHYQSSNVVVHPNSSANPQYVNAHVSPWPHTRNPIWSQSNNMSTTAMHDRNMGNFHDGHGIKGLSRNFGHPNDVSNREAPQAQRPIQEVTSDEMALEVLASMGLFQHPCDDPNCPGDISRNFQEFPFPRRKSTSRIVLNQNLTRTSPVLITGPLPMEVVVPDMFEVASNQDEQRLLLRRMRNREAAKRCRKKKKQEFIELLIKRAILLAEYHRCYHNHHQNIQKQ